MKTRVSAWRGAVGILVILLLVSWAHSQEAPPVNLNTASFAELDSLPGIGPVMAERILEFRKKNGMFRRVEDLMNVRGIGERKFLKLRDYIVVESPKEESELSRSVTADP